MCDEGKDRFGGGALRNFFAEKGTAGQISLRSTGVRCLSAWCLFVLDDLWNAMVCYQQLSLLIGKVWVLVMHFCACPSL